MTRDSAVAYWLDACRRQACTHGVTVKLAELGGDGQDPSFEMAFSNLAHAYLQNNAPTLMNHELGFQLLDRNQDGNKAVGVTAFKVGSQRLFSPVFFLAGELKGHELLYLAGQDLFVPMKENWINYITNRKPTILGSGVNRNTSNLGVLQPDLNRLSQSPNKYASAITPSVRPFLAKYAHLTTADLRTEVQGITAHWNERFDLGHFVKMASLPMLDSMLTMMQQRPIIAKKFDEWYGMDTLKSAIKEAGQRLRTRSVLDDPFQMVPKNRVPVVTGSVLDALDKQAADGDKGPKAKNKVKIITWDRSTVDKQPDGLTEEDAEKLLKDNVLIEDHRDGDEVSVAYTIDVEQKLSNPHETGLYMVLTKPGDFEKCLVIVDPHGPDGRKRFCTIIRLDAEKRNWGNFDRKNVWVAGQIEELMPGGEESWMKFFDELPTADTLSKSDDRYMLIGPRRNATCPFKVLEEIGGDGVRSYNIDMADDFHHRWPFAMNIPTEDAYDRWYDGCRLHLDAKKGTSLRSNRGDIYIPEGYKVMKLNPTRADVESAKARKDKDLYAHGPCCPGSSYESDTPAIMPGNLVDAERTILTKTAALKVASFGNTYAVNGGVTMDRIPTLIHLVRDHGLRQDIAGHLMKQADATRYRGGAYKCRIKYADPYMTGGGPSAPVPNEPDMSGYNPMGFAGPTMSNYEQSMPVTDMSAANTDTSIYNVNPNNTPDPMDANAVQNAAASGQKEVFDTAMIGAMLKTVRDDTMVDRYIPDLIKGMDRLGRVLFMFFWHQDKFAERYGKQDLPELEDSLRNSFENVGDTVLFLKQKTIDPYPEESMRELDLSGASHQ